MLCVLLRWDPSLRLRQSNSGPTACSPGMLTRCLQDSDPCLRSLHPKHGTMHLVLVPVLVPVLVLEGQLQLSRVGPGSPNRPLKMHQMLQSPNGPALTSSGPCLSLRMTAIAIAIRLVCGRFVRKRYVLPYPAKPRWVHTALNGTRLAPSSTHGLS